MPIRLMPIIAPLLVVSSLAMSQAQVKEPEQPAVSPVQTCFDFNMVAARMGNMKPLYDLQGAELEAMHANYKVVTGDEPPDDDRLVVYGNPSENSNKLLALSFKDGCVKSVFIVPYSVFMKVLTGNRA